MVNSTNSAYASNIARWRKNRIVFKGADEVKKNPDQFIFRLGAHMKTATQPNADLYYQNYVKFCPCYNPTSRTISSFLGSLFRKSLLLTETTLTEPFKNRFGVDGETIYSFSKNLVGEVLLQGRAGMLIDYPAIDTSNMTKAEYEESGIQPYATLYRAEDIINWKVQVRKGKQVPVLVVLTNQVEDPFNDDIFEEKLVTQYTVLSLNENNIYTVDTYLEGVTPTTATPIKSTKAEFYHVNTVTPKINGKPLDFIPFFVVTSRGVTWDMVESPMSPIVDMNISYFNLEALLAHSLVLTSSPTPVIVGYNSESGTIRLGGSEAIILPAVSGAGASYLEFTGAGVESVRQQMKDTLSMIGTLGSKLLDPAQGASNISAESLEINSASELSVVTAIALASSEALTKAMRIMVDWNSEKEYTEKELQKITVAINTDLSGGLISANHINSISLLNNKLLLSDKETFELFKRGELIDNDKTYEAHDKEIKESKFYDMLFTDLVNESQSNIPTKDQVQDSVNNTDVAPERYLSTDNPFDPNAKKKGTTPDSGNPD